MVKVSNRRDQILDAALEEFAAKGYNGATTEEVLPWLERDYFTFSQFSAQTLKLVVGEAVRRPQVAEMFVKDGPGKVLNLLKAYLEHQIESGRLRPHDVRSSGSGFRRAADASNCG
jgi:hypothetical protein